MSSAPPGSRLQGMLQAAVQSVQWTYSLFWQVSPQQGNLVWGDGYYNGAIKTRKTVQPMEVSAEEASLQRSQQLRELYESLSAGETNQPARRPSAALSPEDLTESEWFYLMCVSFSFPPGTGLPGKAYSRRQHVWLTGANEVDSKTFSRAILAKSARIQTVVCIPLLDGVVEFGTTDKIPEDLGFVQHVKGFFTDHHHPNNNPMPPKPALSEHSTSNPATSSDHPRFHSPPLPPVYTSADPPPANPSRATEDEDDEDEDEEDDDEEDDHESDSEAETGGRNARPAQNSQAAAAAAAQPSELMQLEMSEDIRLGSPDDGSNNLEPDFNLIESGNPVSDHQRRADSFRAESARRWNMMQEPLISSGSLQPPPSSGGGPPALDELTQEDTHYSQTVSTILQGQPPVRWAAAAAAAEPSCSSSSAAYLPYSTHSAFAKWTPRSDLLHHGPTLPETTSQWLLKYVLLSVPYLHTKYREENSPKSRDAGGADSSSVRGFGRAKGGGAAQDELSANHVLAERRRREKLNERFIILRSLVPFVTKMDKASILGDTIEYVKQLRKKIQDLEANKRQMEADQQPQRSASPASRPVVMDKRKLRIVEGAGGGAKAKAVVEAAASTQQPPPPPPPPPPALPPPPQPQMEGPTTSVEVSIIESDALIELQCGYREGLLLDIMQMLRDIRIETTAVLSSLTNGIFVAELRAKVKDNVAGKKVSIMEVKRAINQIIPRD